LYPDFVPDVFLRLWKTDLSPEERYQREKMLSTAREEWEKKLESSGHMILSKPRTATQ